MLKYIEPSPSTFTATQNVGLLLQLVRLMSTKPYHFGFIQLSILSATKTDYALSHEQTMMATGTP